MPELCAFHSTVRLEILEDDGVWPEQVVHLPYKEPQKDPAYFLAWDYLEPTTSRPLQPREHGDHHYAKAMEMDRTCHPQRAGQHHKPSPRKEKVRRQGISCVRARYFTDVSNIGTHSLRAGGATAAANVSIQDRLFKRHGRWVIEKAKDDYVKDSIQSRLAVSRSLGI